MRPIRDLAEIQHNTVLYHSAFGFARVRAVEDAQVLVQWEEAAENLPSKVSRDSLQRVYARCRAGGFFDRAIHSPDQLKELLQVDPPGALHLLLEDLEQPQNRQDLCDWVVGRGLMTERSFDRWWERLLPLLIEDPRFRVEGDAVSLRDAPVPADPVGRLDNPLLPAARRLELAREHRVALGEARFRAEVLRAWQTGGTQVRDLALEALKDAPADEVLRGLCGPGSDAIDALIHALRHGPWTPEQVPAEVHRALIDRVTSADGIEGSVDDRGRLAAALWRWGAADVVAALATLADTAAGRLVVAGALSSLPPKRAEALCVSLLERTIGQADAEARWLVARLAEQRETGLSDVAEALEAEHPDIAAWIRSSGASSPPPEPRDGEDLPEFTEEGPQTVEITAEAPRGPVSLADLPPRLERAFLPLGVGIARALARLHAAGRVASPTRESVQLHPDGTVEIAPDGDPARSPRPPGEPPSRTADVYAAGVLLLETLIGRQWPRHLSGDRAIPFLRHVAPELPPAALAPLAVALDPLPQGRPADAVAWLVRWQAAAGAEEARGGAPPDTRARLRLGYDTHVGRMKILHTQTNQDALYVAAKGSMSLMVVCDGISTANTGSGDLAAGISAQVIASLWEQWLPRLASNRPEDAREYLDRALRMANQAVCEASLRLAGGRLEGRVPMGTTAVVAVGQGNRINIGWLGDSRAFVIGPYGAGMLTADANQAGERMLDWHRGQSATWDGTGFALVRYVGHFDDLGHAEPLPASHTSLVLLPGERLVLCSDGITDYIADSQAEVAAVLGTRAASGEPDDIARTLVDLANKGGGGDNATVIVATVG